MVSPSSSRPPARAKRSTWVRAHVDLYAGQQLGRVASPAAEQNAIGFGLDNGSLARISHMVGRIEGGSRVSVTALPLDPGSEARAILHHVLERGDIARRGGAMRANGLSGEVIQRIRAEIFGLTAPSPTLRGSPRGRNDSHRLRADARGDCVPDVQEA
jgi:hypothetical protein